MKKYLILVAITILLLTISAIFSYKYRKGILTAKKYLTEKAIYRNQIVSDPLIDKIPKNEEEHIFGLDLSHHQQHINWDKVLENPPHFIIFKTTEGSSHTDTKYEKHIKEAKNKGILVGGYHFFSYRSSGKKQAHHFLKHLKLQKGDIIPVLDVEFSKKMHSDAWIKENIAAFISTIEQEIGIKPIVYCEVAYYNRFLRAKYGNEIHLWLSDFSSKPNKNFVFWQKTDKYKQTGIQGTVDYNLFNGTKEDLIKICY